MRSVVVVLPASMWAIMPMFLHRSNGTVLDTALFLSSFRVSCSLATEPVKSLSLGILCRDVTCYVSSFCCTSKRSKLRLYSFLPPVVREGLIGLGHTVNVFFLLDGCAFAIGRIEQLIT